MWVTSPKGEGFCDPGLFCVDVPGETHIGMHLRRLLGRPWLCTGSNSKDLFKVAQAISFARPFLVCVEWHPDYIGLAPLRMPTITIEKTARSPLLVQRPKIWFSTFNAFLLPNAGPIFLNFSIWNVGCTKTNTAVKQYGWSARLLG